MNKRWIGSCAFCIMMLTLCVHPSTARLSESKFVPLSEVVSNTKDNQVKLHQIKKGDTLYRIARQNKVDLKSLMQINKMNEGTVLEIGTMLKIPTQDGGIHIIAPGDTLANLAQRYEISMADILNANPGKNPLALEVGDCLIIPSEEVYYGAVTQTPSRGTSMSKSMIWPVTGTISSGYGARKSGFHHGLDIANKIGTPIHAADSGTVVFAGIKSVYGRTVIIKHTDGKQTLYAHAKSICVGEGERINQGDVIAYIGISGVTTGPHLHFEVRIDRKTYDPLLFLR